MKFFFSPSDDKIIEGLEDSIEERNSLNNMESLLIGGIFKLVDKIIHVAKEVIVR
jgi:hypothetical protein